MNADGHPSAAWPMPGAADDTEMLGINDVARKLGITQRTLRFYEDKGLIEPSRISGMRVYSHREVGRMQLILRGKRLGFSIREIKEFLDLYDTDPTGHEQMRALARRVAELLVELEAQRRALDETIGELHQIADDVSRWLATN